MFLVVAIARARVRDMRGVTRGNLEGSVGGRMKKGVRGRRVHVRV